MKRGISLYHICVRPRRYGLWLSNNAQLDLMDGEEENVLCHYSNLAFLRLTRIHIDSIVQKTWSCGTTLKMRCR